MAETHPQTGDWLVDDDEFRKIIRRKSTRFQGRPDQDLEQQLQLKVAEQAGRYDPARGTPEAYVRTICDYALRSVARHLATEKHRVQARCIPLDIAAHQPNKRTDIDRKSLKLDVQEVVARLPDDEREICHALSEGMSERKIAKSRGLTRSALRRIKARIRHAFRRCELDTYFRTRDSS